MDKYEYKLKTEQMLEFMDDESYDKAAEIADTIDWRRVRNATMLSSVSDIYDMNGDFQKSYDVLSIAYERASGGRKVVYRLGTLALKLGDIDSALGYYEQFMQIAPKDPNQHILKYKILRAQRAPVEEQVEALEEFKKAEYIEKWAYELAKLYEEAGMTTECLDECDDLILWFSEGKYVYQAMELKMQYKPLTPSQQEKYDNRDPKIEMDKKRPAYNKPEKAVEAAMATVKEVTSREINSSNGQGGTRLGDTTTLGRAFQNVVKKKVPTNAPTIRLPDVELEIKRREMIKQEELEAARQQRIAEAKVLEAAKEEQAAKEAKEREQDEANDIPVEQSEQETEAVEQPVVSDMKEEDDGQMSMEDVLTDWEKTSAQKKEKAEQSISAAVGDVPTILPDDIQRLIDEIEGITPETHATEAVREPISPIAREDSVDKGAVADDLRMENLPSVDEDVEYEDEELEDGEYEEEELEDEEYEEEELEDEEYEEEELEDEEYEEEELEDEEYEEEELEDEEYEEEELEDEEYEEEELEDEEYEEEELEDEEYEEEE
ncbi:MAG: hypothetical protein PHN80_13600, partial [Hespellia sp.]|nr:hypothetical protein [Hespellia sp.]